MAAVALLATEIQSAQVAQCLIRMTEMDLAEMAAQSATVAQLEEMVAL